jgi:hypothetical protein
MDELAADLYRTAATGRKEITVEEARPEAQGRSHEQIAAVLQQAEQGVPVGELCRQVGISEQSFYRWKKVYGGLHPSEVRELKQRT